MHIDCLWDLDLDNEEKKPAVKKNITLKFPFSIIQL